MIDLLRNKRYAWIPAGMMGALFLVFGAWVVPGWVERLDVTVYDQALRTSDPSPVQDIVVISVDAESTERLGAWPWPRSLHSRLLEHLHDSGASLVAFTMPLNQNQPRNGLEQLRAAIDLLKSDSSVSSEQSEQLKLLLDQSVHNLDEDSGLASAIAKHGNVLLPIEARLNALPSGAHSELRRPAEQLSSRARGAGHVAFLADRDGITRADLAGLPDGSQVVPSLALAIAARMRGVEAVSILFDSSNSVAVGEQKFATAESGDRRWRWYSNFYPTEGPRAITQYSYWQVLSGAIGADKLNGKTVLIGIVDPSLQQAIRTPIDAAMPVVMAVANVASSYSADGGYRHPAWAQIFEWLFALAMLGLAAWLLPNLSLIVASAATILLMSALLLLEAGLLNATGLWLQLALSALVVAGAWLGKCSVIMYKRSRTPRTQTNDPIASLRMLGLTFQGQGQLDLALETFRRCPNDTQTLDLLYGLGQDYERRRQFSKATEVYTQISASDATYKDVAQRRERTKRAEIALASPPPKPTPRQLTPAPPPRAAVEDFEPVVRKAVPKQTLGRYEIERELGKGAMGVVYLGRDPNINRVVAIKAIALAEEFAEEDLADARARFFREAEMAGRLNHPGIVTVYDVGEDRGLAFIAMEFLRGEHLSHYAEPVRLLPVARVFGLAARVADALDYAHRQNVVHRDIKPANIMFNADTDELKLTDFGIARLTDTSRTKTGIVLGTPSFMSPEQLEGRPLDGRSDLFALGVALYQLLTGQLPFRAESMTRLMHKIAMEAHVPLRSLRPELPELAEQIMSQTLAKHAVDRFQTGAEMATALRSCIRLVTRKEAIAR